MSGTFQSGVFGEMVFLRDDAGAVTGFTANSDRIRRLRFDRVRTAPPAPAPPP